MHYGRLFKGKLSQRCAKEDIKEDDPQVVL